MMRENSEERTKEKPEVMAYLIFILIAYLLTGVLLLILAFLLYRFQLGGDVIKASVIGIYVVSCFLAGFLAGKKAKNRKWLWGLLMGTGYFLILTVMSLLTNAGEGSTNLLPSFFLCAGGGILGGMFS